MLVFSLLSASLSALEVNDLYQANVVVDSQDRAQREQAIKKALAGVFLKIGGKKSALSHDVLQKAQKKASRYVSQYRYQRKDEQLSLVVSFNEDKVNDLFKEANLALWGSLRPQVLLWLIDEQGTSRSIVASNADSIIPLSVNDFSIRRGLPIVMPLMDLTDSEQVVLSDFWGYFHEQVQEASLRYSADTVVVMRVSDSTLVSDTGGITPKTLDEVSCGLLCEEQEIILPKVLDWKVYTQGALYTQQYQGVDKVTLITQGLSDITELIYQSYALSTSAENDFVIEVQNVTSLKGDTQLFDFLIDLSAVNAVTLISAKDNVRQFKLDLIGSKASFIASLKLNNKLTQQIKSQIDHSFDSMIFDPDDDLTDDFNRGGNKKMKVIILGNDDTGVENADGKMDEDIINSTNKSNPLNTNTDLAPGVNEQLISTHEEIVPLIIVPNIPVFYWEQG